MRQRSAHRLHAGNLCCEYANGSLRNIRSGTCEILQHIYFAVRDRDWGTIPYSLTREEIQADERSFRIELEAEHRQGEIDFVWRDVISGSDDGRIIYAVEGEAQSDFLRNRIGLCVLHPAESCRGGECTLEHTDGTIEPSRFPDLISPHQPFFDLRAITHRPLPGVTAQVRFAGDVFETEDQRNWSDASFKTYSTPLAIPYPAGVKRGDRIRQQVALHVTGNPATRPGAATPEIAITIDPANSQPMGELGVAAQRNKNSAFDHVRIDLDLSSASWCDDLQLAAEAHRAFEVAVFIGDSGEWAPLRTAFEPIRQRIRRLLVFHRTTRISDPTLLAAAREILGDLRLGGGSDKHFAELNRNRDLANHSDFLVWPIDPQAHATDTQTAIENLGAQRPQLETARSFTDLPLHISPITVPEIAAASGWAAICARNLLLAGARSLTFRCALPILEEIARFRADRVLSSASSDASAADALVLQKGRQAFAWVANFLPEPQVVTLAGKPVSVEGSTVASIEVEV